MYFNALGEKVSAARYREMANAAKNRRELIAAGLTSRRDLFKMGLLTAGGMLVPKLGLSARARSVVPTANQLASPSTTPWVQPLFVMPQAAPVPSLNPAPTIAPDTAAGESRTRNHQGFAQFPPNRFFNVTQQAFQVSQSPQLPLQTIWGFNDGTNPISSPGPTYASGYFGSSRNKFGTAHSNLVRNNNGLPTVQHNGGFGLPSVTTHLHNGHTPSESDGFPCDFFEIGHFYDQHYPNVLAGINSTNPGTGDINEALSTLWYHDHRVDFTSQNTYKGLLGFYLLFNDFDTGDETTGFHLPSYPDFDVPLAFADKVYDPKTGLLAFDLFNLDGILGDKFLVNGRIQPFFNVQPRRYRFRLLDTGPSRFYDFFLTDLNNLGATNQFWVIANDGNLLPAPVQVSHVRIGVAERVDVVIDFRPFAGKTIYLENRLNQINGQGPVIFSTSGTGATECNCPETLAAGAGNLLLQFRVGGTAVQDNSADPSTQTFYSLPSTAGTPAVVRTFKFDRLNGQWSINGQFMDCNQIRLHIQPNSIEHWILTNATGDWTHPIHIHEEEHQILSRTTPATGSARNPPTLAVEHSRKDVVQLHPNERVELFFRFRDWLGRYPLHCHNVIHEDHAMMLRWEIDPNGGDHVEVP
jgi:FtsP/CotA-like multicopper oxidase with cupredoxin domain